MFNLFKRKPRISDSEKIKIYEKALKEIGNDWSEENQIKIERGGDEAVIIYRGIVGSANGALQYVSLLEKTSNPK